MRIGKRAFAAGFVLGVYGLFGQNLLAHSPIEQSPCGRVWNLPRGTAVKNAGPRTYRFTVEYNSANSKGEVLHRYRLTGEYTRGLVGGEAVWKNVTEADADGATAPFGAPRKIDFMEGFRYRNDLPNTFKPEFFKGFPPTAVFERNLVWDTGMIETFGQNFFDHLKLNQPYHVLSNQDVKMPDVGTFRNSNVVLEWIGRSQRNRQDCAVITYQAFFNPLRIVNGGMTLEGRSDYWGEIWVSLATRQIEYGTLHENVLGEMKVPGQNAAQIINLFRIGALEPVAAQ
ncbi:MAG: hypothetical protein WB676_09985 [Bryobacteraceae bacterium]